MAFIKQIKTAPEFITAALLIAFLQAGCVSRGYPVGSVAPKPPVYTAPKISTYPLQYPVGMYYRVESGQTLWSISKNFGVSIDSLKQHNQIFDVKKLAKGARIFVPARGTILPIATRSALSKKWRYIIVHHSATDVGAAQSFDTGHKRRGFRGGLGYHFVIDNGSQGTRNGDVEIGRRWFYQMDGAHCQAGGMNKWAIGICLVGNFNTETPSEKQISSLIALIDNLRQQYRIPLSNIKGHGDVSGARTECPGRNFPWYRVKKALSSASAGY